MKKILGVLLITFLLVGCSIKSNKVNLNDKYGVIFSNQYGDGKMYLYNNEGKLLGTEKIPGSAVDENGSSYLNGPQFSSGKWYLGCSSATKMQDFLLTVDKESLYINKVPANVGTTYGYTGYQVNNDDLYTFYSTPDRGAVIIKSSISTGKKLGETSVGNSILMHVVPYKDDVILISDSIGGANTGMAVRIMDSKTLTVKSEYFNEDNYFINDVYVNGNKLYMVPFLEKGDRPTNKLLIYDIEGKSLESIDLPFTDSRYIRVKNDLMYITQQKIDSNKSSMVVLNMKNKTVGNTVNFDYVPREVVIDNDTLVTATENNIYIYDLETLKLIKSINVENIDSDLMFGAFICR